MCDTISVGVLTGQGPMYGILRLLVFGDSVPQDSLGKAEEGGEVSKAASPEPELSTSQYCMKLILCICGLQVSYLVWGILQVIKYR